MKRELTQKNIRKTVCLYIFLLMVINAIGAIVPANFEVPINNQESIRIWKEFMFMHMKTILLLNSINFLVPILLCILYMHPQKKDQLPARFINMPFRFAGIGCTGWLLVFIREIICLCIIKNLYEIKIFSIIFDVLIFSIFMSFLYFTISYFVLESIHRKVFLPQFFPEGKLTEYKVNAKASLRMKIRNFYISVAMCPILYLLSRYVSLSQKHSIRPEMTTFFVTGVFILLGIILSILIFRYLDNPLKKLKSGAEQIEKGNFSEKIKFISNDDFGELTDAYNNMIDAIKTKTDRISMIQDSIIKGMALMVESRDVNTGGHIGRTSDCVQVFAQKLMNHPDYDHVKPEFFQKLIKAAPMHDLGKIAVDDAVLRKPGKFTDEEYELMKKHSEEGAKIVEQVIHEVDDEEFKEIAINVAHYHHEKWNGQGYPAGLKEEEIPFEARIMALADVFDALVSKRCYKDSFSYDRAFSIIEESLGTHFDPFLGLQFISCRKELEALYNNYAN